MMPRMVWSKRRGAMQRHSLLIVVLALWIQHSGGISASPHAHDRMVQLRKLLQSTATGTPTATPTGTPIVTPSQTPDEPKPDVGILPMPPTKEPTASPVTAMPTESPTTIPTPETATTAATSTPEPSDSPTAAPTELPTTPAPTPGPTTLSPTASPTPALTTQSQTTSPTPASTTQSPTASPTPALTTQSPTAAPTPAPTTQAPTAAPTPAPTTQAPTAAPTPAPTTKSPTPAPTDAPTTSPTEAPALTPAPTVSPDLGLEEVLFSVLVLGDSLEAGDTENLEKVVAAALDIPAENVTMEIGGTMVVEAASSRRLLEENRTVTEVLGQVLTDDPEGISTMLSDEAVQQEIVDGAAEEGVDIIPSSFVVGEPEDDDDGSCDLTWEGLKFWEEKFWTENWCWWKITIVACVGALILILLLWIILDCFCIKCCCGKMCSKGGGCCPCCSTRESEKYRLDNYDYRFQADPQPDGRPSEVELPTHASMQRPMYQADGYTDDQARDELLGNTSTVSAAMPTRLTTESNPRLEDRRPSGLVLNSQSSPERGRPALQSPGDVDIDIEPMSDTDTEDDMDDSEDEDFDDEDLSSINSPGPESSPGRGGNPSQNARLPSYSEESEPGYEMDPNRHNQHLQQRPFASQQQPSGASQQLARAPSGWQTQVSSQLPGESDSESMLDSSDPESDFSDMESDLPMGAR